MRRGFALMLSYSQVCLSLPYGICTPVENAKSDSLSIAHNFAFLCNLINTAPTIINIMKIQALLLVVFCAVCTMAQEEQEKPNVRRGLGWDYSYDYYYDYKRGRSSSSSSKGGSKGGSSSKGGSKGMSSSKGGSKGMSSSSSSRSYY